MKTKHGTLKKYLVKLLKYIFSQTNKCLQMNYTNYTTGYKMTESFADDARCHTETFESVEGEPVCELLMKFQFTVILLLSFWHQKLNVTYPEIQVNNSDILMRSYNFKSP